MRKESQAPKMPGASCKLDSIFPLKEEIISYQSFLQLNHVALPKTLIRFFKSPSPLILRALPLLTPASLLFSRPEQFVLHQEVAQLRTPGVDIILLSLRLRLSVFRLLSTFALFACN